MALSVPHKPLPLPSDVALASIGLVRGEELHGGHQSRVFTASRRGQPVAIKLTEQSFTDAAFERRLEVVAALSPTNRMVVGPLPFEAGQLSVEREGWVIAMYPLISGRSPEISTEADVRTMGNALARLHQSLRTLGSTELPVVAPLAGLELPTELDGPAQLLHGDFSSSNTIIDGDNIHIIDFDGCGYGPVEYEIGETLYGQLFDATVTNQMVTYERFRAWFVDEYRNAADRPIDDPTLDTAIRLRIGALERWLDEPDTAPIGVRSSTPEWREVLRSFIRSTR